MWIDGVRKRPVGRVGRGSAIARLAFLAAFAAALPACGDGSAPASQDTAPVAASVPSNPPAQLAAAPAEEPRTLADLFPEGEGRDLVLNNCSACHAAACAAMGQRPASRWEALREAHREHVPSLSDEQLRTVFAYLGENFDDRRPEPFIPAHFLERGCTPF
jgi:mono/diheme cytochrome c family protein